MIFNLIQHNKKALILSLIFSTFSSSLIHTAKSKPFASLRYSKIALPTPFYIFGSEQPFTVVGFLRDKNKNPLKNEKVKIFLDGKLIGKAKTNNQGVWIFSKGKEHNFTSGEHTLVVASPKLKLTYPEVIVTITDTKTKSVDPNNSYILWPEDQSKSNDNEPIIVGVLYDVNYNPIINESIDLSIDSNFIANVQSDTDGVFYHYTSATLADGLHTILANTSPSNIPLEISYTVDTVAPGAPTVSQPIDQSILTNRNVAMSGTAEAFSTAQVFNSNGNALASTIADSSGNWSVNRRFYNGQYTIYATATDTANNVSAPSANVTFTVNI